MTLSTPVSSRPALALSRRGFMALGGIGMHDVLAACGGKDSAKDEGTGPLRGTTTIWPSFTQGPHVSWTKRMAEEFHKESPDVTVGVEQFSWFEFKTRWTIGLTVDQVPGISTALSNDVVEMINSETLVPLDRAIGSIGRDRFPKQVLAEGQSGGKSHSMPIYSHAQVMWYRRDVLNFKGLSVPTTWEELAKVAKVIGKSDSLYGFSVPLGTGNMLGARYLNSYVRSAGQRLLRGDRTVNLTSGIALRGIKYWTDLYKLVSPEESLDYAILDQTTLFYQGKAAFDFSPDFHISRIAKDSPNLVGSIAAASFPRMKVSDPANYPAEVSNVPLVIRETSKVKREAKAFLEFLFIKDRYIEFLHSVPGGMLPVLNDIVKDPSYANDETIRKCSDSIRVVQDQMGVGIAIGMEEGPLVQAGVLTSQGLIEKMYHSIIIDKTDIEAAIKDREKKLNETFKATETSIKWFGDAVGRGISPPPSSKGELVARIKRMN